MDLLVNRIKLWKSLGMAQKMQGAIRLFRIIGIDVFLHWSWFLVAVYEIQSRAGKYSSIYWNVMEYLALFLIVLMHEFGHALACRKTGGKANEIVLWPLGGIAYVSPPQRPGAMLWSIAAGPLVNVALLPVIGIIVLASRASDWAAFMPNAYTFIIGLFAINLGLLIFNLLPIYPLDGGQILRSLLWFAFGRARSLMIAATIGFIGVGCMLLLAFWTRDVWFVILAVFVLLNCWSALKHARALARVARLPRREGFSCPSCLILPPRGAFWICAKCRKPFDTFETNALCPHCGTAYSTTTCLDCGVASAINDWNGPALSD
jgi:Zn-dependent protease